MFKATILIKTASDSIKYVRNVTTDTFGENEITYGYRGNARRKINLTIPSVPNSLDSGLKRGVVYTFQTNVNVAGLSNHKIDFPNHSPQGKGGFDTVTYFDLINALNSRMTTFDVKYIDRNRAEEGIYFIAKGNQAATSIVIQDGVGDNPLFASLKHFDSIGDQIASDNLLDQTGTAGKILQDFNALATNISSAGGFISFPENGGATEVLVRSSNSQINSLIANRVVKSAVQGLHILEVEVNTRENWIG